MIEQVGGNHYAAAYQHWDWAAETALGPLEYAATKYVSRWWLKGGAQDLDKAESYLLKLRITYLTQNVITPAGNRELADDDRLRRFLDSADIPEREAHVIALVDGWTQENGWLDEAIAMIQSMSSEAWGVREDNTGQAAPFGYNAEEEEA